MELRHIRYFVAVAEELHFTRAAERLGIKQPPLSQQIGRLEAELGTLLFRRLKRSVELTESGALLLHEARKILEHIERAKATIQRRARGETGRIVIGFAGSTNLQPLVPAIVRAYREKYPDLQMMPEQSNSPRLIADLRQSLIDVAFVRPPLEHTTGIQVDPLIVEPMVVVLPSSHPLARARSVSLGQLAQDTFLIWPRAIGPGPYDAVIASCRRAGFFPRVLEDASQLAAIPPMVEAGFGISIVPQSLERISLHQVAYKPIAGEAPRSEIALAYRTRETSPAVRNFVALARRKKQLSAAERAS
jgi:DNA-binding transcriptional LysR family regulator